MAREKRRYQKMTPEEEARRDENQRLLQERIAYRRAREREWEERPAHRHRWRFWSR